MKSRRLLVLDLNGTILHRLTHAFETKLFRNHPIVISEKLKPDITIHGCKIVFRPHAITFLTHILKHFDVAVWTSSRPQNALPMVHHSFKNMLDFSSILEEAKQRNVSVRQVILGPSDKGAELMKEKLLKDTQGKTKLKFIWTQSECDTVAVDKKKDQQSANDDSSKPSFTKPLRKKDLDKIYSTFPACTPLNTIIIDDTDAKLIDHLENHLCLPEFNVTDHSIDFTADKILLQVKKYLDRLLKEDPEDVRTFLAKYDLEDC